MLHHHCYFIFWFLFLSPFTLQQSSQRDMDREVRELDRQEKQVVLELKQRAKTVSSSNDPTLKALAKQLVQIRTQRDKMISAKAQLGAMGMHATVMASQIGATSALSSVTESMKTANKVMDVKATTKIMVEFQRENERMNVKGEMMDDMLASAFDNDEMEEEAENVTNQVLAELGVELDSQLVGLNAPSKNPNASNGEQLSTAEQDALDDLLPDLKARLNAL
jgi:division protein CdvB (Snf7/Vps24/ESCRT-III family)